MSFTRENLAIILFAIVAVVLQLLIAPYITIAGAAPNIIAAYVIVVAVVRPSSNRVVVLAFILGLCYNLFEGGPVGGYALILTALAYLAGRATAALDNDTAFFPIVLSAIMLLLTELVYALLVAALGMGTDLGQMIIFRTLPCIVYDIVISLLWYALMKKIAAEPSGKVPPIGGPTLLR